MLCIPTDITDKYYILSQLIKLAKASLPVGVCLELAVFATMDWASPMKLEPLIVQRELNVLPFFR